MTVRCNDLSHAGVVHRWGDDGLLAAGIAVHPVPVSSDPDVDPLALPLPFCVDSVHPRSVLGIRPGPWPAKLPVLADDLGLEAVEGVRLVLVRLLCLLPLRCLCILFLQFVLSASRFLFLAGCVVL